jgi:hypothetical protein
MNSQTGYSFRRPNSSNGFYGQAQLNSLMNLQGPAFQNVANSSFGKIQGIPSQGFSQLIPQGFSQGLSTGFPQGFSQGMPQGFSQGLSQGFNPQIFNSSNGRPF